MLAADSREMLCRAVLGRDGGRMLLRWQFLGGAFSSEGRLRSGDLDRQICSARIGDNDAVQWSRGFGGTRVQVAVSMSRREGGDSPFESLKGSVGFLVGASPSQTSFWRGQSNNGCPDWHPWPACPPACPRTRLARLHSAAPPPQKSFDQPSGALRLVRGTLCG